MKKLFILFVAATGLAGCGSNSGDATDIPDVELGCTNGHCLGKNGNSYDAVTAITTEGCAPDQIDSNSVAVGTTRVSCDSSGCTGSVSSWKDKNGAAIAQIASGTYYVCNWIDFNSDSVKNSSTDEFSELRESILSASNIDANGPTWGVTYASRGIGND